MSGDLSPDTFRPHIRTAFAIEVEGAEPLVLTLEEVRLHPGGHDQRAEPFTLLFSGPVDRMAPQATLRLAHDHLGPLDIFLVPVETGRYEAVFN
jgi:hypothetical protein